MFLYLREKYLSLIEKNKEVAEISASLLGEIVIFG